MTVEKPKPKQLLRPITTGAGSAMNQSQFLAITCNSLEARGESRVHGAIGFGLDSHWLKNWRESFKPITKHSKSQSRNNFRQSFENCSMYYLCIILCESTVIIMRLNGEFPQKNRTSEKSSNGLLSSYL